MENFEFDFRNDNLLISVESSDDIEDVIVIEGRVHILQEEWIFT